MNRVVEHLEVALVRAKADTDRLWGTDRAGYDRESRRLQLLAQELFRQY